jgi:AraC-like DNA-binding protein
MSPIEAGVRGGGIAVLLLLALFGWRDARRAAAGRYGVLFMLCSAAYLVESSPGPATSSALWILPLRVLSVATPAVFLLWARATFDDLFRPSWLGWLPVAAMAGLAVWAIAADRWLPWRIVNGAALLLTAIGVWRILGGRAGDLIEGRRRFRVVLAIGAGSAIGGFTVLAAFSDPQIRGYGTVTCAGVVLILAAVSAALRLTLRTESDLATEPAGEAALAPLVPQPGAAIAIDPEERQLLDRLRRLMDEQRIYREERCSIAILAGRLGIPEYRLRRLINQRLGHRNFSTYINGYRLAETIAALADPSQARVPILTIALDAGFGSLGPFNRAFKAQTGVTPTDYRRERLERNAAQAAQ